MGCSDCRAERGDVIQRKHTSQSKRHSTETKEQREYRGCIPVNTIDVLPTLKNRERQGYRGCVPGDMLKSRERQGYRGCVPVKSRDLLLRLKSRERQGYIQGGVISRDMLLRL